MALIPPAPSSDKQRRDPLEGGLYAARCYQVVHIGTIPDTYNGEPRMVNKVRITWELPNDLHVFDESKGPQPIVISKKYTLSLGEKAILRKDLEGWRGKAFTEDELKTFDLEKLVGVTCMLNLGQNTGKDGNIYEQILSIAPLMKGLSIPNQINPSILFTYDPFKQEVFDSLPDFLKTEIEKSEEYKTVKAAAITSDKPFDTHPPVNDDVASSLPF